MLIRLYISLLFVLAAPLAAQTVPQLLERGDSALTAMKPKLALDYYTRAQRTAPEDAAVLWRLSRVHTEIAAEEKDEKKAEALLQKSLRYAERAERVRPQEAMAQVALSVAYGQLAVIAPYDEKVDLSKKIYAHARRALELDGRNHVAMLVLGMWHREVASLNWALKLVLDAAYGGLPDASLEQSHELLAEAVTLRPDEIMPRVELAKTLLEMDRDTDARRQLRRAISLRPSNLGDPRRIAEARELLADL
ncbi:hypothetical protein KQI65_14875 [bacterium]|nr:hypothetical protein [bacterium]